MMPMHPGMGPKLIVPLIVMAIGYFVMVAAAKQEKKLKVLGFVIGLAIIILTGLMFAKAVVYKCSMVSGGKCPMTGMVK